MDTTLRDGEQTSGVSFGAFEKLSIARLLLKEIKVNRLEIASARVSAGEMEAVKQVCAWAAKHKKIKSIEVLGFIDNGVSLKTIANFSSYHYTTLSKWLAGKQNISPRAEEAVEKGMNDFVEKLKNIL